MDAVLLVVLPAIAYVAGRIAGALAGRTQNRTTAATRLQRSNRALQAVAAAGGLGLATASRFDDAVAAATPGPPGAGVLVALAVTVLGSGALPALAVHLGTRPAWQDVVSDRLDYAGVLRRYAVGVFLVVGPAFLVVGAWVLAPSGLPGVATVVAAALLVVATLPLAGSRVVSTRRPTPAEATALPPCARGVRVRVVDTDNHPVANALAAGFLPGARYVFVTDALFAVLDREAAAAVVAHEVGHHERAHIPVRFAAMGVALVPLFLVSGGVVESFPLAVTAAGTLLLAVGPVVRWTEFDADAYAASHADPGAMQRALETLAARGLVETDRSRVVGLVSLHPSTARRIDRLEERDDTQDREHPIGETRRFAGVESDR
ncbi:M48 family metallopeptidase [Halobacterium zhouii]|uniref:M48 family metallopeptidase n=1 Tax=Halobacterium zhouii TaxID=2902624 RepID=UPI001E356CFE|nr:M48 family metalloprotease [Halobacterium zhouii]